MFCKSEGEELKKVWILGRTLNDIWAVYDSLEKAIEERNRVLSEMSGSMHDGTWILEKAVL